MVINMERDLSGIGIGHRAESSMFSPTFSTSLPKPRTVPQPARIMAVRTDATMRMAVPPMIRHGVKPYPQGSPAFLTAWWRFFRFPGRDRMFSCPRSWPRPTSQTRSIRSPTS
jgi:hypothetical protein